MIEQLIDKLSENRKFFAKLSRIAREFETDEATVINEGVELYRRRERFKRGPLGAGLDPDKYDAVSAVMSRISQKAVEKMDPQAMRERGLKGAQGRIKKLKAQAKNRKN